MRFCIMNGTVHTAISPTVRKLDILVEDGKIAAIGANLGKNLKGKKCELVDAAKMQVYPGLVEAHSHLGLEGYGVGYDAQDLNEYTDIDCPELRAIDGINPFLETFEKARAAGVTCVATGPGSGDVLGGTFAVIKTVGRRVDDMVVKYPVAMKCAFGENPKNLFRGKSASSRLTAVAHLRNMLFKAREYLEKKEAAAKDEKNKAPDFNLKLEALLPVLRREIPLKAHAHQTNDILTAIRIAKEFNLKMTLEHVTEGHLIADIIAKEGFPVAVGPTMTHPRKYEVRNKTFDTPVALHKAGCKVSIITDAPVISQEYLGLAAGLAVRAGMDPYAALQAITINPATLLGVENRVGSLEVGKDADIVIADGSLLDSATTVKTVFIDGKRVVG